MFLTILSGTYVLPCTVSRRTQRSANHISLQSSASINTTGVLRLYPNNSLQGADEIVSFYTITSTAACTNLTVVSSSPYITFHTAFRNSSFQRPPPSDNIHLSIIPCGLDERNQSIVVCKIALMSEARSILLRKLPHAESQPSWSGPLYRGFIQCSAPRRYQYK
jgi:hypothetical protein